MTSRGRCTSSARCSRPRRPRLELPAWWDELLADPRPIVLVTQGTIATDPRDLLQPTLRGAGATSPCR